MPFKGKKDGAWSDASVVYGKSAGSWLYGRYAVAKKDGAWIRAWTDCRLYDAGGREWSDPVVVVTYSGSCASRTQTTTTTRTKLIGGCPNDVRSVTVASPDCGTVGSACWTNVNGNYVGQTVTWAGVSYTVQDIGSGEIWVQRTDNVNQYCSGGQLELYTLWACGSYQGVTYNCYNIF